jgi:hypothetical protein
LRKKGDPITQIIPFALFEDLRETIYLMEYANGIRPYVLEWYYDVFLEAYNSKTEPDSKVNSISETVTEKRIALTTEQLVDKTKEVYNRTYTTKQILENYVNPPINQGYIDKTDSDLDKRSNIYYPVITTTKERKLFEIDQSNNFSQKVKIRIVDTTSFPNRQYLISKIQQVLTYSADKDVIIKIESHQGEEIAIEELVDRYYNDYDKYFEFHCNNDNTRLSLPPGPKMLPFYKKEGICADYLKNAQIASKSQRNSSKDIELLQTNRHISNKLFEENESNNFLYSCYYCNGFHTNLQEDYEHHGIIKHPGKPVYPSKVDLEKLGIKPQGKEWEI